MNGFIRRASSAQEKYNRRTYERGLKNIGGKKARIVAQFARREKILRARFMMSLARLGGYGPGQEFCFLTEKLAL